MQNHYSTIDKLQCTRCGKDVTGLSKEDFKEHIRVHTRDDMHYKYPELFQMIYEIERKYNVRLVFEFND